MRAALHDPAVTEDDHPVGGGGLAEPVCHDQCRTAPQGLLGGLVELAGARAARLGGRLVEDHDRRIGQQQAGQGELLGPVGGEPVSAVADDGLQALRQRLGPAEGAHRGQRLPQLIVVRLGAGQPQIVGERSGEDVHLLRDEPHQTAGLVRFDAPDVDPSALRPVQPRHQLRERRLARPGRTDQRDPFLGPDLQIDAVQHRTAGHIRVGDRGQRHGRGTGGGRTVVRALGERGRRLVHHPDQAGQSRRRRLGVVEQHERGVHRSEEAVEVQRGGRRGADRGGAGAHQQEPGHQDGAEARVLGDVQTAVEAQHQLHPAHRQFHRRPRTVGDPPGVAGLEPVRPYGPRPADRVEQLLLLGPGGDALPGVQGHGVAHVPPRGVRLYGQGDERGQQEPPVQQGEGAQGQHDRQRGARQLRQRAAHRVGDPGHVPGDPGVEVAGARLLQPPQWQGERTLHEQLAQPGEHGLAEPGHQRHAQGGRDALHHGDPGQREDGQGERVGGAALGDHVDDVTEQGLGEQSDGGGEHHQPEPGPGQAPMRPQQLTHRGPGTGGTRRRQQGPIGLRLPGRCPPGLRLPCRCPRGFRLLGSRLFRRHASTAVR